MAWDPQKKNLVFRLKLETGVPNTKDFGGTHIV